jgi:hypothetical protein
VTHSGHPHKDNFHMTANENIPWKRLSVEAAAIVGSILLAFAIDAWWEERLDRQMERDDLERLHAEFIRNRDRINDMRSAGKAESASAAMYELLADHLGQDVPVDVPNTTMKLVRVTPTFDAVTPALDGLILSGRLENIRDGEVLLAVHYWQRHRQQVEETELTARKLVLELLIPALVRRGNMGPSFSDSDPDGITAVIVDEELLGLVAYRANYTRFVIRTLNGLEQATNDVVVALEQALAE